MKMRAVAVAALWALFISEPVLGADRFVSVTGSDVSNDCTSSSAPCRTIVQGVAQAGSGDTIKVAVGTYTEFVLIPPITVTFSGGWAAGFGSRDPAVNVTTIAPNQFYSFLIAAQSGETYDVTVDGFSVIGDGHGETGGIVVQAFFDSSVTFAMTDTKMVGTTGLALVATNTGTLAANVDGCTITKTLPAEAVNVASRDASSVSVGVTGCSIAKNRAEGIFLFAAETSSLLFSLTGSDVARNKGTGVGAVSYENATLNATISDSLVDHNKSAGVGGGVACLCPTTDGSGQFSLSLIGATVTNNQARFDGGGVFASSGSDVSCTVDLTNAIVSRNKTLTVGGGIAATATGFGAGTLTLDLTNATVTRNRSSAGGGGVSLTTQAPSNAHTVTADLTNTILFNNRAPHSDVTGGMDLRMEQPTGTVVVNADHDDIGDTLRVSGTFNDLGGNISAVPLFVSAKDLHLTSGSPCIDSGTCAGAPAVDIDGDPRPSGAGCDIGADEFVP